MRDNYKKVYMVCVLKVPEKLIISSGRQFAKKKYFHCKYGFTLKNKQ